MTDEQKDILKDTLIYAGIGTVVSIPLMFWMVPKERSGEWPGWGVPVALTVIGLGMKLVIHHYLEGSREGELGERAVA